MNEVFFERLTMMEEVLLDIKKKQEKGWRTIEVRYPTDVIFQLQLEYECCTKLGYQTVFIFGTTETQAYIFW